MSFEAILHKNGMMGRGRALLACDGFVDPRWVPGEFHADSADTFSFHWYGAGSDTHCVAAAALTKHANCCPLCRTDDQFVIYFHRYDPEVEKAVVDDGGMAITNTYLIEGRPRIE